MSAYGKNKPARYYICCDSDKQKEDIQNLLANIDNKTHKTYGQNLLDGLTHYHESLKAKRGM
ncbi:MAG: hypothetical protein CVV49_08905 [Spirochaetae bacterium HGW-Spirochaetae-5]|nr:MAG: hypothetical protein CVV49_08905 [Spirochaetae bacterium HGW-Spirochaetae-5]